MQAVFVGSLLQAHQYLPEAEPLLQIAIYIKSVGRSLTECRAKGGLARAEQTGVASCI